MKLRAVLSENLKRLRAERHLSQEALAYAANIERSYVSKLERKRSSATLDTLEKLAAALELDPLVLITDRSRAQNLANSSQ